MQSPVRRIFCSFFVLLISFTAYSQAPKRQQSSEIYLALQKLQVLGSALYIAAHPDDENTRLITWLGNEKLVNTGYLSLTRGDGGQNLIGAETGEQLGVIRTQELLQARKIDGGQQFFSSAIDFGFSKHPSETFSIWDREKVLSDMVWVIRKFRPDILITRFSSVPGGTHGHHTASAILAEEAFQLAGDPSSFPEQLKELSVWEPKKIYWNTSWWFYGSEDNFDKSGLVSVDVGKYNALLGKSYTEIAAESRSMHKSQGFGAALERGSVLEYLKPIKGADTSEADLFEGIDISWNRLEGGKEIGDFIANCLAAFDPEDPSKSVPDLLRIYKKVQALPQSYWRDVKQKEIRAIVKASLGLYLEASASKQSSAPGENVSFNFEAVNRSSFPVTFVKLSSSTARYDSVVNQELKSNQIFTFAQKMRLPEDVAYTQPYWLEEKAGTGMFSIPDQELIGMPEDSASVLFDATLRILDSEFNFSIPLVYKYTDPVKGEQYQPFEITPPAVMNLEEKVYIFPTEASKKIKVLVTSAVEQVAGDLSLQVPQGWQVSPLHVSLDLREKGAEKAITFEVTPPKKPSEATLTAMLKMNGNIYKRSLVTIDYDHIPKQTLFPEATAKIVKLDIKKEGEQIGYIMGAGDDIPASLEQIGYEVDLLNDELITAEKIKKYDAIILGVRAYNTIERLKFYQPVLFKYVEEGGTLIVQYNTTFRLITEDLAPYPLSLSRDRVTVEDAEVRMLEPDHPALNFPNKITSRDFEGWVQERGLYFPDEWSDEYVALLSSNDPGEDPKEGGLLVAPYGKGYYIYTGYSWFRELPAGVPGAYRIFTNLISISKSNL